MTRPRLGLALLCLLVALLPHQATASYASPKPKGTDVTASTMSTLMEGQADSGSTASGDGTSISYNASSDVTNFTTTPYTSRRHGYADVLRYLRFLTQHPDKRAEQRLEQETATEDHQIEALKSKITHCKDNLQHSSHMLEMLHEERQAAEDSLNFATGRMERFEVQEQLKKLAKDISHENKAARLWTKKMQPFGTKIQSLRALKKKKRFAFAERRAKRQTERLKRWSREKVDFSTWRAANTGTGNRKYMEWKLTHKVKAQESAQKSQMERMRHKLEATLEQKVQKQFLSIKEKVAASSKMTEAQGILNRIKLHVDKQEPKRIAETKREEREKYHSFQDQLSKDTNGALQVSAEEKALVEDGKRHQLENGAAKQKRLNGLARLGLLKQLIGPRSKRRKRRRKSKSSRTKKPAAGDVHMLDANTNGEYFVHTSENPDPKEQEKDAKTLAQKLAQAKAEHQKFKQKRKQSVAAIAAHALADEGETMKLSRMRLRNQEMAAKASAIKRMQTLHAKLAKLQSSDAAQEMEHKVQMAAHAKKLMTARKDYELAKHMAAAAEKTHKKFPKFPKMHSTNVTTTQPVAPKPTVFELEG